MSYNRIKLLGNEYSSIPAIFNITRSEHYPVEGVPPREVNGATVWVNPKSLSKRRSTHRAFIKCPVCGRSVPIGRFAQHTKRKDHRAQS